VTDHNDATAANALNRHWAQTWQRAADEMAAIHQRELSHFDYEAQLPAIDAMLTAAFEQRVPRPRSGLVDQQRAFTAMRHLQGKPDP
jgi:hypothetical protein